MLYLTPYGEIDTKYIKVKLKTMSSQTESNSYHE